MNHVGGFSLACWPLLVSSFAWLPGCASADQADEGEQIEQHGTATQDVEVAEIRNRFARAYGTFLDLVPKGDAKKTRAWSCDERDAKQDAAQKATKVTYVLSADGTRIANSGTGFGKVFFPESDTPVENAYAWIVGYPAAISPGEVVTHDIARVDARGARPKLYIERILRPSVKTLSPSEQAKFDALSADYQSSVSMGGSGLAVAYVVCNSFTDS